MNDSKVYFDREISYLAANLLRIMAGAGRTMDVERQLNETNNLAKEVYAQSPITSESTINEALELHWPRLEAKTDGDRDFNEEQSEIESIVIHSLRIAAAKITGNNSAASKSESDLYDSLRRWEDGKHDRRERSRLQFSRAKARKRA